MKNVSVWWVWSGSTFYVRRKDCLCQLHWINCEVATSWFLSSNCGTRLTCCGLSGSKLQLAIQTSWSLLPCFITGASHTVAVSALPSTTKPQSPLSYFLKRRLFEKYSRVYNSWTGIVHDRMCTHRELRSAYPAMMFTTGMWSCRDFGAS